LRPNCPRRRIHPRSRRGSILRPRHRQRREKGRWVGTLSSLFAFDGITWVDLRTFNCTRWKSELSFDFMTNDHPKTGVLIEHSGSICNETQRMDSRCANQRKSTPCMKYVDTRMAIRSRTSDHENQEDIVVDSLSVASHSSLFLVSSRTSCD
jgi:hypothetical protein